MKKIILFAFLVLAIVSCRISYKFNGSSIDYSLVKTIRISEFQNQAPSVYPPLTQVFNEYMKDFFTKNTKLTLTEVNPDLELEGEITRYDLSPLAIKENSYASETRLTMTVRMRYKNNKNPQEDKEESITAYRDFTSDQMLTDVQDRLIDELTKDIVDQIFNTTMSNW